MRYVLVVGLIGLVLVGGFLVIPRIFRDVPAGCVEVSLLESSVPGYSAATDLNIQTIDGTDYSCGEL
jgi:hypothetical protein